MPTFHVDEHVRQGAAPLVLLEPVVQPAYSLPVSAPRGAVRHANNTHVDVG
ncbi:hypothetical protein JOF48_002767 [Arthrobacter stackebrandtii]|uniref:Uncharacterized protein n=1 Tax=Arthrobacter stackebrandtii TaxID=272161 RepID=A0ABS4Z138_9MICC|nr:hypothetical protein [Arthrobacter stackebrandtii]MBP2413968.1 hypothetical protein [Arthrobacter stackebrandtii]